jgi:hypothetical protein
MCKEDAKNFTDTGYEESRVQETPPRLKEAQPQWKSMWRGGTKTK